MTIRFREGYKMNEIQNWVIAILALIAMCLAGMWRVDVNIHKKQVSGYKSTVKVLTDKNAELETQCDNLSRQISISQNNEMGGRE